MPYTARVSDDISRESNWWFLHPGTWVTPLITYTAYKTVSEEVPVTYTAYRDVPYEKEITETKYRDVPYQEKIIETKYRDVPYQEKITETKYRDVPYQEKIVETKYRDVPYQEKITEIAYRTVPLPDKWTVKLGYQASRGYAPTGNQGNGLNTSEQQFPEEQNLLDTVSNLQQYNLYSFQEANNPVLRHFIKFFIPNQQPINYPNIKQNNFMEGCIIN